MNNQHVQVPTMNLKNEGLKNIDPYIYACIKKYMNKDTKTAFPSLITIVTDSGITEPTILKSINRLEKAGYFKIEKEKGKSNRYIFNDYKKFEIFSYEFLEDTNTSPKEKAYLITSQALMYKDPLMGIGKITLTNMKLSESINLDVKTMKKYEQSLQDKNILQMIPLDKKDEAGVKMNERIYSFEEFANTIALKFIQVDDTLNDHEKQIKILTNAVKDLQDQLNQQNQQKDLVL